MIFNMFNHMYMMYDKIILNFGLILNWFSTVNDSCSMLRVSNLMSCCCSFSEC